MSRAAAYAAAAALALALAGCVGTIESVDPGQPRHQQQPSPDNGGNSSGGTGSGGTGNVSGTHSAVSSACELGIDVRHEIFIERCGACHGSASPRGGLDLVTPGAVARMLGKRAASCGGRPLITDDGAGGVLFDRVEGSDCAKPMPPSGDAPLDRYELDCLYAFVRSEAAQGSP
ncbi:MAG: hypothetical protein KC503_38525 [Myxococcales bacterium]|nr:hypothetical protein [Myxococcales bacterium]